MDEPKEPSHIKAFGFATSVRAIITGILVVTVCILSYQQKEIKEPLYGGVMLALAGYFGNRTQQQKPPGT